MRFSIDAVLELFGRGKDNPQPQPAPPARQLPAPAPAQAAPATRLPAPATAGRPAPPPAKTGQPVSLAEVAQAVNLGTRAEEPVVLLREGALLDGVTPEMAEAYIKAEIERAVRFQLETVGALTDAARQERLVSVGFITSRRRKRYTVVLPIQMIGQPVADALMESWTGLREKVHQDGNRKRDYAGANQCFEKAITMLHDARQHLSDLELAFAVGTIGNEIVYL